ncbi:DsbA family protein [Leptolyngbya sp. 15MV]|nr:DsbA family protein [Leptolyngbya sp. 15MV]
MVLVVVVVGLILYLSIPDEAPVPEAARTRYQDISAGTTEEGYPRLGSPTAAVQVALYTSFDCATCKAFYEAVIDDMLARVRSEQIAFTFVPLFGQGTTVQNGQGAARAAICAGLLAEARAGGQPASQAQAERKQQEQRDRHQRRMAALRAVALAPGFSGCVRMMERLFIGPRLCGGQNRPARSPC